MHHYSKLTPADVLIELIASSADQPEGEYRTISNQVLVGQLKVSASQLKSCSHWAKSLTKLSRGIGAVCPVSQEVASAHPVEEGLQSNVFRWVQEQGLPDMREPSLVTPLGCWAAPFHEDVSGYGDTLFCVLWTSPGAGLELVFPHLQTRVPLECGTLVLFDAGQPHGVLRKGKKHFVEKDYTELDVQTFISFDFGSMMPGVPERMGIQARTCSGSWPGVVLQACGTGPRITGRTGKWCRPR